MIGWFDLAVPVDMSLADAIPSQLEHRRRRDRGGENGGGQNRDRGSEAAPAARPPARPNRADPPSRA